ncbi:histone H2A deubiquitinase [Actinidia rufa]|uniref:Histone H2A deubiquitinase n=1 Tax=Actinidia rufa TaxID=165716 RepID=A0A7J0FL91_9ERIC|nr:histone H2A deubiquitinase [Actinidia rufa]
MAASANPTGKNREASANGNGATTNGSSVPHDNAVVAPTQAALRHNPGLAVEWTADEQSLLDELLTKFASEQNIVRYAKIAMQLKDKTVRDVALRCRWLTEKNTDPMTKSASHAVNRSNDPPYAQSVISIDSDDGISYEAIGGVTGQLLEQNAHALDQISSNFAAFRIHENTNLFCQARHNILTILNDLNDMPEIMKQMPPLPVNLNEDLATSVLHLSPLQKNS